MADETRRRDERGGAAGEDRTVSDVIGEEEADAFAADVVVATDEEARAHGAGDAMAGAAGGGTGIGDLAGGTGIGTDDGGNDAGGTGAGCPAAPGGGGR